MLALFCADLYDLMMICMHLANSLSISLSYFAFVEKCIGILSF